jgi:hypothetical protein
MMSPKARLVIAAGLFVAWLGWLVYLVTQTQHPVILSRPQFLVADLYITARLERAEDGKPAAKVTTEETLWAANEKDKLPPGTEIMIANLPDCEQGWEGPAVYLLPLVKSDADTYRIAPVPAAPRNPGFTDKAHQLRIYLANDEARRQVREIMAKQ